MLEKLARAIQLIPCKHSPLSTLQCYAIDREYVVEVYGFGKILEPLLDDIQFLETEGIEVELFKLMYLLHFVYKNVSLQWSFGKNKCFNMKLMK